MLPDDSRQAFKMTQCISSYAVSYEEMISSWVQEFHSEDYVVVIYDPLTHIDLLRKSNIELDEQNMFSSKVLILIYFNLLDRRQLCLKQKQ